MAAAVSAASHGSGQAASRRLQSTSSTSSRVTTGATPSPVPPIIQQVDNSTGSSTTEEATNATTSNVSSPSAAVTREKPTFKSLPTLEDLNGLKSRRLVAPHEAEPASSAIVGMYTRRFKNLYFRVNRAFNKEQLAHLARLANIGDHIDGIRRKADLIKKIMTLYWDLTDPAQYALKESERKKLESQEPYDITEGE